ncbi:hypothetical protein E2C01_086810 [Portunus trituberculatus]|uniref:Uncharacterized protein n=1 Tax=Portunus trituberculatus TaxID=210409 RepID=A0A5B7JBJ0_PORTR|nr:hypothetical protein [Portunus trituberculatus]
MLDDKYMQEFTSCSWYPACHWVLAVQTLAASFITSKCDEWRSAFHAPYIFDGAPTYIFSVCPSIVYIYLTLALLLDLSRVCHCCRIEHDAR